MKDILVCSWALAETECLIICHQVSVQPELPIMTRCYLTYQTIKLSVHSSVLSSNGNASYIMEPKQILKAQVSYINLPKPSLLLLLLHCLLSLSLHLWKVSYDQGQRKTDLLFIHLFSHLITCHISNNQCVIQTLVYK